MTHHSFPFPDLNPLTRLHIRDDLKINAERWSLAHGYHRQRQNIIYQSLWEPGIVCGLGIKVISPPETTTSQFRDQRWLEIQPGIAIDVEGNPIIVSPEDDRTYRIAAPVPTQGSITVHVVIRYVDPDSLEITHNGDRVIERFRLDQRTRQLEPRDIELCRIEIERNPDQPGDIQLKLPAHPQNPGINELDLRCRQFAQIRCQSSIKLGILENVDYSTRQSLLNLTNSLPALYPQLNCVIESVKVDSSLLEEAEQAELIYLSDKDLIESQEEDTRKINILQQYLKVSQGFLLVEVKSRDGLYESFQKILNTLTDNAPLEPITARNILMKQPFLFGRIPDIPDTNIELFRIGNILLIVGHLSQAWSGDNLLRHEIREAQEFGINLLHFVWQQSHFRDLLQ